MSCGIKEPPPADLHEAVATLHMAKLVFSVQQHQAKSLHWDFRLQHDGVLVSWAIPKGLPEIPEDGNRLGIKVEDHALDYVDFHGDIPDGYGAGKVQLIDVGPMEVLRWEDRYIKVILHGQHYIGTWSLRNTKGKNWIVKRQGE